MSALNAIPTFSGPRCKPEFYANVDGILAVLRPHSTLAICARHLNAAGFRTPTGLTWTRSRVAAYIRNRQLRAAKINSSTTIH